MCPCSVSRWLDLVHARVVFEAATSQHVTDQFLFLPLHMIFLSFLDVSMHFQRSLSSGSVDLLTDEDLNIALNYLGTPWSSCQAVIDRK